MSPFGPLAYQGKAAAPFLLVKEGFLCRPLQVGTPLLLAAAMAGSAEGGEVMRHTKAVAVDEVDMCFQVGGRSCFLYRACTAVVLFNVLRVDEVACASRGVEAPGARFATVLLLHCCALRP